MYKVLLVEDEEIIRKGIRHSVPWESCNTCVVGEAGNGVEGVEQIRALQPDIVITDINMPVMDGLKMIEETRLTCDYASIILTGYSEFEYAMEAIRNGVSGYVLKPLNIQELLEALRQAVLESENIHYLRERNRQIEELREIRLITERAEDRASTEPVVKQALDYIRENYRQKISIADLERELHYSERYINQKFQKEMGTTVIEYLNRYRIQNALVLLREGEIPISEIGWQCGIGEYKYFNHVFKKYIGCSAKEYQSKVK